MSLLLAQTAVLERYLGMIPWVPVGIGAAVALITAIVVVIVRRRRAKKAGTTQVVTPSSLVNIWSRFLAQIPAEFRRYVLHFQGFVVLGEAGSGKSQLIGKCTDWKGQAAQFYPSYTSEPLLQLYLGSRALVQEVPSALLADTSQRARTALVRLWSRTGRKRAPVAVVAISAATLREASPDALRTQAQTLRGKLNVLARIANAPIETRVVVTHMDQVEGYLPFAEFVEKQEIPHKIKLDQEAPGLGLPTCLEPFEDYLSLALTKLPARDYLRVLTFLSKAPATFERLGLLLTTMREDDPRSFEPALRDLYLSSNTGGGASAVSNPFETTWAMHGQAIERAVSARHRLITAVIALLGLAWLGAGFGLEHERLTNARSALEHFEAEGNAELSDETESALNEFAQGAGGVTVLLPSYSSGVAVRFRARLAEAIREKHLRPILGRLKTSPRAQEKALYLLGLVYAHRDGPLGKFILDDRALEWGQALELPEGVIEAYVRGSDQPWAGTFTLEKLGYDRPSTRVTEPDTWHSFFLEVGTAVEGGMTPDRLERLQRDALELQDGLAVVRRRHTTVQIARLLASDPRFPDATFRRYIDDLQLPAWLLGEASSQFDDLLKIITDTQMRRPDLSKQSLQVLVNQLEAIRRARPETARTIRVTLGSTPYEFQEDAWLRVVNKGTAQLVVKQFVRANQGRGAEILFESTGGLSPIAMRTANEFFFPGEGLVPAQYTKEAYNREVVKQVATFEESLRGFDLDKVTLGELDNLVSGAVEQYATEYERQWRAYYASWSINAGSLGNLKIIAGQMKLPASRFQDFLQTVVDNTSLGSSSSGPLGSFAQRLTKEFEPLARVVGSTAQVSSNTHSALEDYRSLLGRVLSDLEGPAEPADEAKDGKEPADIDFDSLLTPLGRQALEIVREGRESHLRRTREWLAKEGLADARWREPFLQPIRAIEELGRVDIALAVDKSWNERVRAQIVPLLERFPFNPRQTVAATPRELEEALHPVTGAFWVSFRRFVAPICVEQVAGVTNRWRPIKPLETGFTWSPKLFEVVNHLTELTATLYDKDGLPRPIVLTVRAEPMPQPIPGQPAPILTFIGSGEDTVFGFNQRPIWQLLDVEWFTRLDAQVGLQLGTAGVGERANLNVTVPEGYWALHRLLRTRPLELDGVTFPIETGQPGVPTVLVRFSYKEDPFRLFAVPSFEREEQQHADN